MIVFDVIKSPDEEIIERFKFFQNILYLGRTNGNLLIKDNSLLESHLMIEVVEKDLIVHPQKNVTHYLIDGKRSTNIRKIRLGQQITLGQTTIKIVEFSLTAFPTKKEILDEKLQLISNESSPKIQVIEMLAQMMK